MRLWQCARLVIASAMGQGNRGNGLLERVAGYVPLYYKSVKYIKVDVPEVCIVHRILQVVALAVALLPLHFNDAWALVEEPGGAVNAWEGAGRMCARQP